jgi:hypothetical protein
MWQSDMFAQRTNLLAQCLVMGNGWASRSALCAVCARSSTLSSERKEKKGGKEGGKNDGGEGRFLFWFSSIRCV